MKNGRVGWSVCALDNQMFEWVLTVEKGDSLSRIGVKYQCFIIQPSFIWKIFSKKQIKIFDVTVHSYD